MADEVGVALRPSGEVVLVCGRVEVPGEGVREGGEEPCRDRPPSLCSLRCRIWTNTRGMEA